MLLLLISRIGFNWFVLPDRLSKDWGQQCKLSTIEAVSQSEEVPVIFGGTGFQPTNSFYATQTADAIIYRQLEDPVPGQWIIFNPESYINMEYEESHKILIRWRKKEQLLVHLTGIRNLSEE